jgi:hypothetical protein
MIRGPHACLIHYSHTPHTCPPHIPSWPSGGGELIMARLMITNCSMGFFTSPSGPMGADRESFLLFLAGLPASALDYGQSCLLWQPLQSPAALPYPQLPSPSSRITRSCFLRTTPFTTSRSCSCCGRPFRLLSQWVSAARHSAPSCSIFLTSPPYLAIPSL